MTHQAYKVVSTHSREISGWKIVSRLIHSFSHHLGGINGDFRSDLATLAFNNEKKLEYLHSRILRLQQEIIFSGETLSPTIFIFQYMKAL